MKKIFIILIAVLLSMSVLSGCANKNDNQPPISDVPVEVGYKANWRGGQQFEQLEIVKSANDLISFLTVAYGAYETLEYQDKEEYNAIIGKYSETYFETKALIPIYFSNPYLLDSYDINVWVTKGEYGSMVVNVEYILEAEEGSGGATAIMSEIIFLEVIKSNIHDINNATLNVIKN